MGMDTTTAAATQYAGQQGQGGAPGAPGQNPLLARLMPLIQQRMQQQAQGQSGGGANPFQGRPAYDPVIPPGFQGGGMSAGSQGQDGDPRGVRSFPVQPGPPSGPVVEPGGDDASVSSPVQPAWQELAKMGVGGQGSAAANRAMLAKLQAAKSGAPPQGADIALDPIVALRQKIMDVAGGGAMRRDARPGDGMPRGVRTQPQARPAPGAVPAGGDPQAKPMPGVIPTEQPNLPTVDRTGSGAGLRPRGVRAPVRRR